VGSRVCLDILENRKLSDPAGIRAPDRPVRILISEPTTLTRQNIMSWGNEKSYKSELISWEQVGQEMLITPQTQVRRELF
jgi:hypothetical protein